MTARRIVVSELQRTSRSDAELAGGLVPRLAGVVEEPAECTRDVAPHRAHHVPALRYGEAAHQPDLRRNDNDFFFLSRRDPAQAVETIVEVNTYLSSVGFESGGLAAAHAIQKGFTFIPELHDLYHGCKVAFCTLAQLVMEDAPRTEVEEVLDFCR